MVGVSTLHFLQCFDTTGQVTWRTCGLWKILCHIYPQRVSSRANCRRILQGTSKPKYTWKMAGKMEVGNKKANKNPQAALTIAWVISSYSKTPGYLHSDTGYLLIPASASSETGSVHLPSQHSACPSSPSQPASRCTDLPPPDPCWRSFWNECVCCQTSSTPEIWTTELKIN